jgi:hypothetical protein
MTEKFGRLTFNFSKRTSQPQDMLPWPSQARLTLISEFALQLTALRSAAMLPTLSERWGANLQVLVPTTSEPASASARRNALHELKEVDSICVNGSGRGSKARYAVEVIIGSPTATSCLGLATAATGPTVRVDRGLSEFKDVANEIHDIVDTAHPGQGSEKIIAIQ